ncbi:recombinase family protein [Candidatus Nomurabacteria bacterium]|nr:recombinase family protein [Candidatus Nomurabacteria bacterium]MCB9826667.1 recombinase family protein [Candidatus Nomurabacteria bacterium]
MNTKQEAIIYSRVSGELDNPNVIENVLQQENDMLKYAELNNLKVVSQFRFLNSTGDPLHQIRLLNVLGYMQVTGIHVLLCYELSRLFRDVKHLEIIKDWLDSDKKNELRTATRTILSSTII